jgi:AraC-like DNA-binding protein
VPTKQGQTRSGRKTLYVPSHDRSPASLTTSARRLFESRIRALAAPRHASRYLYAKSDVPEIAAGPTPADLRRHVAGRHEFALPVSGRARVITPLGDHVLTPGQLLLIDPAVEHTEMPASPPTTYVMCWCACDSNIALIGHSNFSPPDGFHDGPVVQLSGRTDVQSIVTAVGTELANRAWGWPRAVQGLLHYLSCVLIRRLRRTTSAHVHLSESPAVAPDRRAWVAVQRAVSFCRVHLAEPLCVEDVATAVGYSPSHLSHLFSSFLGQSLAAHIRGLRLARAQNLLENTDLTVRAISRQVGYSDPAHFTRAFISQYGLSPRACRQRMSGQ